jgi:hypothetical protein
MKSRILVATFLLAGSTTVASCSDGVSTNPTGTCGDAVVDTSETCDGASLGGATCESQGFGAGTLACGSDCKSFDASQCGAPAGCGDSVKSGVEVCDGSDLGGQTCAGLGLGSGNLGCKLNCLGFETGGCSGPASCGDGTKDGSEVCDGNDLDGQTCETIGAGTGTLACAANCVIFDTTGCICAPSCGGLECGPDPVCGESCGECEVGSMCNAGKCLEICDLPRVLTNTTLNVDIKTVTLTGKVTLNGLTMPNDMKLDGQTRGYLRFQNLETGDYYDVDFGETGAVNYSVTLFAGVYNVQVHGNYAGLQSVLPGNRDMRIATDLELKTSMTKDFDARTVKLTGNVTLNGATMPNDTKLDGQTRGELRFLNRETGDDYRIDFGETGAVAYSQTIFAGAYDIYVYGNYAGLQSVFPGNRTQLIQRNVPFTADTTKDIDAKTLTLSGKVTLNGQTMPNDTKLDGQTRGYMRLRNIETADQYDSDFGETGGVNYSQTIFAGLYDIYIYGNYAGLQSVLPANRNMVVQRNTALSTTMTKDIDAKTLTISGKVTVNGTTMPNDTKLDGQTRGYLRLQNVETVENNDIDFGETGGVNYSQTIFAGLYDVYVHGNYEGLQSVFPGFRDGLIEKNLALTSTITKDFDAKVITLSGNVTLNGSPMPNDMKLDGETRGYLRLQNLDTFDYYDLNFAETGPVTYSRKIFAGRYDVYAHGNYAGLQSVLPGYRDGLVQRDVTFMANATQNFDVKVVTVMGQITLNGQPLPNDMKLDGQTRGALRFWSPETFSEYQIDLGETGPVMYSQKLFAGAYDVLAHGNYAAQQTVLPGYRDGRILKGCRKQ